MQWRSTIYKNDNSILILFRHCKSEEMLHISRITKHRSHLDSPEILESLVFLLTSNLVILSAANKFYYNMLNCRVCLVSKQRLYSF